MGTERTNERRSRCFMSLSYSGGFWVEGLNHLNASNRKRKTGVLFFLMLFFVLLRGLKDEMAVWFVLFKDVEGWEWWVF